MLQGPPGTGIAQVLPALWTFNILRRKPSKEGYIALNCGQKMSLCHLDEFDVSLDVWFLFLDFYPLLSEQLSTRRHLRSFVRNSTHHGKMGPGPESLHFQMEIAE